MTMTIKLQNTVMMPKAQTKGMLVIHMRYLLYFILADPEGRRCIPMAERINHSTRKYN